jgi:transposase
VPYEFTPEGQTINQGVYLAALRCLHDAVQRIWPEMWTVGSWLLHHDNVPAQTALSIRQFLTKHSIPTLPQPSYSPDLSPLDFFFSLNLTIPLKEEDFRQWNTSLM